MMIMLALSSIGASVSKCDKEQVPVMFSILSMSSLALPPCNMLYPLIIAFTVSSFALYLFVAR